MSDLLWSAEAIADLSEIWNYYATNASPLLADELIRRIEEDCRILEAHPLAGRSRDELREGLRSLAARPYVVFFRVLSETAEIIRVLHGRRDIENIFSVDEPG